MRKTIFILLFPFLLSAQDQIQKALEFQNNVRSYFELKPYSIDPNLEEIAYKKAVWLSEKKNIVHRNDQYGELIYVLDKDYLNNNMNCYLDASVGWVVEFDPDIKTKTLNQIICHDCSSIGFGYYEDQDKVYVVAIYDKMFEL